ncbi:MAG: hypothetical protein FWE80_04395, partial [Oscillospiraceae bacterium]|nr:hypothetical protein [Oscillospiraceae bacterium]
MNDILYTANNRFFIKSDDGVREYTSRRITKYYENVRSIRRRHEWKTSGEGAKFIGAYDPGADGEEENHQTQINGVAGNGGGWVYSVTLGDVGGLCGKTAADDAEEEHIFSSNTVQIYRISVSGNRCAASVGDLFERHIAVFDLAAGQYRELTEGNVREDYPAYSRNGDKIFFSSAGLAVSADGYPVGAGPSGIFCYDTRTDSMEELLMAEEYDYLAPREDRDGNLLFIRRPYKSGRDSGNILKDILLFPVRLIRAIGGLLNLFSVIFGGESLRSGQSARDVKAKRKKEKDLFFDGNVIQAQQTLKENQRRGEKFPGIIPHKWELVRADKDGEQTVLKKGVMDYTLCENGDIVYSNGSAVIRLPASGGEQLVDKCRMAHHITEL